MSTEKARWAKLAGLPKPTDKQQLDENFVGTQMVGNIFDREKEQYEDAFEHFLSERYEEKVEEFNANYGPGRADYPGNVSSGDVYKVEDTVKHLKSGIEAKVYSNGIIELCKDGKRINAYKFSSSSDRKRGFEKIKDFFEEEENEEINQYDIFNSSGIKYVGTILSINRSSSDECGEKGLKTISWAR